MPPPTAGTGPLNRPIEIFLAIALAILLAPALMAVGLAVAVLDGRPVLFLSERVGQGGRIFRLVKFRTMRNEGRPAVNGGYNAAATSGLGTFLRRHRLDELPQLWNVLAGDMGFVGPRPPIPGLVDRAPRVYGRVLRLRPGVTGLATLTFVDHEERIMGSVTTRSEAEEVYARRCLPRKARIDLIYARRRSLALDLWLIALTAHRVFCRPRRRMRRRAVPGHPIRLQREFRRWIKIT